MIKIQRSGTIFLILFCHLMASGQTLMRDTAEARQYFEKGKKMLSASRYDSAFFYLNQCEKLLEKHLRANDPFRLQARITLATSRQYLGDFNQALKIYRSILEDIDEQENEDDYVKVQNNIASIYKDLFDTQNAQITFEWILRNRIKKYGEKHPEVVQAYVKLGANCNDFKDSLHYEQGLAYFSKALAIQRQLEPTEGFEHYRILEEISEIYRSQGNYQKAIPILKKVLAYRQKHLSPNDAYIGDTHFYLAKNYILAENWEKAFLHLDADLRILRETYGAHHPYFADDLLDKARIFRKQGNFKKALELIAEITHLLIPGFSPDGNESPKEALLNTGYFQQKKLIGVFEEKANILTSGPAGFNDKKIALESLDLAIQLIEETRQVYQEQGSKIALHATYRPVFEHALKLSLELWEQTHDPSYRDQAFTIMEKSKVATLRDAIHAKSAIEFSNIPSRFSEKIALLKRQIGNISSQIYQLEKDSTGNRQSLIKAKNELFECRKSYEKLIDTLEKTYPDYYDLKYNTSIISFQQAQALLGAMDAHLLEYFAGDQQLFVIHLSKTGFEYRMTPLPSGFEKYTSGFIQLLKNAQLANEEGNSKALFKKFCSQSYQLHQWLIAGISLPEGQPVIFIPDGVLNLLPFGVLINSLPGDASEVDYAGLSYLLKRHSVSYENAFTLYLQKRKKTKTTAVRLAAFAPSYPSNNDKMRASASVFTSLKHTEQEARTIARLFHGVTFLRQAATADQFKKAAPEYNILHLALHAFTDDEDPTYSGLIFSENTTGTGSNILHAYELSNMSLNADLVVLSACNTGGGKLAKGEGVMSLARAFRHANCPNIVMSLWQADDEATGKIMADFYRGLKNGLRKDVALQQAKLNYLATNRKCFPYYWSEFVLLGGSDPISRPSSDLWLKWAMGLLVLTGVLWWLKIRFF